jgi:hypothetical protein
MQRQLDLPVHERGESHEPEGRLRTNNETQRREIIANIISDDVSGCAYG